MTRPQAIRRRHPERPVQVVIGETERDTRWDTLAMVVCVLGLVVVLIAKGLL